MELVALKLITQAEADRARIPGAQLASHDGRASSSRHFMGQYQELHSGEPGAQLN